MPRARAVAAAAVLAAAGCGGSHVAPPQVRTAGNGTLTLNVRVPVRGASAQGTRSAKYVSSATQSISVADASGPTSAFDVGPTAPGCTAANGTVDCAFTLILPLQYQTLTVSAYDGAVVNGASQGKVLSTITSSVLISEAQANAFNVVLGGVVADVSLSVGTLTYWDRSTTNVTVVAKDPDGYTIVGPYSTPIAVSCSACTGALLDPYAPAQLTDSSQTPDVISTFGEILSGSVTATVSGSAVTKSVPLTGVIQSGTFLLGTAYLSSGKWFGAVNVSTPIERLKQPMVVELQGFSNGTSEIEGVAFAPNGNVYVANAGSMSVTVHAPGTQNMDGPTSTFALPAGSAAPTAIAADASRIYVLTAGSIEILSANGALLSTIAGSDTQLSGASSIALDASSIYVANRTGNSVAVFPLSASGDAVPVQIAGATTGLSGPRGITIDGTTIYVANTGAANVLAFPVTASGNATPSRTLGGSAAGMVTPYALGFDVSGNLFVADAGINRVLLLPGARAGTPGTTTQILVDGNSVQEGTGMSVWPH